MTAAAPSVVSFVEALAPLAREVGVTLPPVQGWASRIAAIDGVDVDALTTQSERLRSLSEDVEDAASAVGSVADQLSDAWRGVAGERAQDVVGEVRDSCGESARRIRTAAMASGSAAHGVTDVRAAMHATLAGVPSTVLAGRSVVDMTVADLAANKAVVAALLHAAIGVVETAVSVAEKTIEEVLTVLADSAAPLAEPVAPWADASARPDVARAATPTPGGAHAASAPPDLVAALVGAGAAVAASVGTAAAGAAGVVAHALDAALGNHPVPDGSHPIPTPPAGASPSEGVPGTGPGAGASTVPPHRPEADIATLTGSRQLLNLRYDDDHDAPTVHPSCPTHPADPGGVGEGPSAGDGDHEDTSAHPPVRAGSAEATPPPVTATESPRAVPPHETTGHENDGHENTGQQNTGHDSSGAAQEQSGQESDEPPTRGAQAREESVSSTRVAPSQRTDPGDGGGLALVGDR